MSPLRAAPFAPYCDIPCPWPKPCPTMVNEPVAGTVKDSLTLTAPVGDDSSGTTSAAAIRAAEATGGGTDGRHVVIPDADGGVWSV